MGREIKRVPLDFVFPIGASYADTCTEAHYASCKKEDHDECEYNSEPPKGEGWQLWQTVSDGPVTPVFATADELIDYMSQPVPESEQPYYDRTPWPQMPSGKGWRRETAEKFVRSEGRAPSMVISGGVMVSGVDYVTREK